LAFFTFIAIKVKSINAAQAFVSRRTFVTRRFAWLTRKTILVEAFAALFACI